MFNTNKKTIAILVLFMYMLINIAFPFVEVKKAWAVAPACAYPPGAFDPASGYCVTAPLDEKHSCPQYYSYNYETNKCVLMPVCSGLYTYNKTTKQCEAIQATGGGSGGSSWIMPENACAVDSNGDGDIEQNEIFPCTQTPQGYICPQGQTECTQQIAQPSCPAGYTYNGQTQKCEAPTTIGVCSSQNVPYTDYQCPTNGQTYTDASTCNNNCIQTAACNAAPLTLNAKAVNVNTGQSTSTNIGIYVHKHTFSDYDGLPRCDKPDWWSNGVLQVKAEGNWFEIMGWNRYGTSGWGQCIGSPTTEYRVYASNYCTFSSPLQVVGVNADYNVWYYIYGEGDKIRVHLPYKEVWSVSNVYIYVYGCTVSGSIVMFSQGRKGPTEVISCVSGNTIYGCTEVPGGFDKGGWARGTLTFTPNYYTCPLPGGSGCSGNPPTCSKGQSCVTHTSYTNKYQCNLNGAFYDTQDQCTSSCHSGCPAGGSFNPQTGKCEATATCSQGTLQTDGCFTGYGCPLGDYPCMQVNSQWMCSPNQCFTESQIENDDPDMIASQYDSASTTGDGTCTGQWSIFSGSKMRCHKAGIKTGFHNCCDESQGKIYDSVGSTGISAITDAVGAIYAATEAVKIGSYAAKIASGVYKYSGGALVDATTSLPIANFAPQTPEWFALQAAANNVNQGADVAVGAAMGTYIQKMGPQIATAIAQLAVSQMISDPILASSVNLAFSASLWVAGVGGPVGFALAATNLAASLFMSSCDKQDIITSTMDDSGRCHYVGSYCTKKIKFIGCVQKVKSFCCFNSKLARIVQEQGRPQLSAFGADGGWGSAKHPDCRGFTPEEFQALNFDNIDLSEYTGDIERSVRKNIESTLQNTATQSLQNRGVK